MIDYLSYIRGAEDFMNLVTKDTPLHQKKLYIVVGTVLSWSAVESFVNSMLDDFASLPDDKFELHERAFLLEQKLMFADSGASIGNFVLRGQEYQKLENKVIFLISKFGRGLDNTDLSKGNMLWNNFMKFKSARDSLVHPHSNHNDEITIQDLDMYIQTTKDIIKIVAYEVWKKKISL